MYPSQADILFFNSRVWSRSQLHKENKRLPPHQKVTFAFDSAFPRRSLSHERIAKHGSWRLDSQLTPLLSKRPLTGSCEGTHIPLAFLSQRRFLFKDKQAPCFYPWFAVHTQKRKHSRQRLNATILSTTQFEPFHLTWKLSKGSAEWRKPLESGRVSSAVTMIKKTKKKKVYWVSK